MAPNNSWRESLRAWGWYRGHQCITLVAVVSAQDPSTNKFVNVTQKSFWKNKYSLIPSECAECDDSLPFSGASSIPLCYVLFPATLLHQLFFHPLSPPSCHLFLGLPLSLVVSKFIYRVSLFHRAFFNSIMDKSPTHALFTQHYISLACWCAWHHKGHNTHLLQYCCHNAGINHWDFKFSVPNLNNS